MGKLGKFMVFSTIVLMLLFDLAGCSKFTLGSSNKAKEKSVKIGFALDTLKEERWQKDRDIFKAKAEALGAEVDVQACQGDDQLQIAQAENMIASGVDILVIVPHDAAACATIVEKAHASNIPVIAYDRLITNSDLDLYISFDNEKVGELQASYITKLFPKGNYAYIGGASTDNNALLFRQGAMKVLGPLIDKGDIKLAVDQMSEDWKPEKALINMENGLTANKNRIDAVVCANDGIAGGVIQALAEQKLDGKVPVTGQDAELAACIRIVEGKQAMTIYKPVKPLAEKAAEIAVNWVKGNRPKTDRTIFNMKKDVPAILLEPLTVDKDNIKETVIKDGWQSELDVYRSLRK